MDIVRCDSNSKIVFDPTDKEGMEKLMKKYGDSDNNYMGKNDNGENVVIYIEKDNISTHTFQKNGFIRTNIFWKDGTREEIYEC